MYAVSGATVYLGSLVPQTLLKKVAPSEIIALSRDFQKSSLDAAADALIEFFEARDRQPADRANATKKAVVSYAAHTESDNGL